MMRKCTKLLLELFLNSYLLFGFCAAAVGTLIHNSLRTRASCFGRLSIQRQLSLSSVAIAVGVLVIGSYSAGPAVFAIQHGESGFNKTLAVVKPWKGRDSFSSQVKLFGERLTIGFGIDQNTALEFSEWILEAAERQDLSPELIASLVLTESSFRKSVVSHVGAVGPTQVRPDYWASFCGASNLEDPEQNVHCGAQVLRHLIDRCAGNYNCALSAYNVGFNAKPGAAAARYIAKIDLHMDWLENAF
jgi:hypothetical protein